MRLLALGIFLAALVYAALKLNGFIVVWRAEAIAAERPYCIEYASGPESFAPAMSFLDLSFFKMRGYVVFSGGSRGAYVSTNHGLLIIDNPRQFYSWSYKSENFTTDVLNKDSFNNPRYEYLAPHVRCKTSPHFGRMLPVLG